MRGGTPHGEASIDLPDIGASVPAEYIWQSGHFDLIVRNATIIDGTRAPRYEGDIAVRMGVSRPSDGSIRPGGGEIDASGRVAAPGFIDAHTHDDRLLMSDPEMTPKVSQGVTTVIAGNCGISLAHSPRREKCRYAAA